MLLSRPLGVDRVADMQAIRIHELGGPEVLRIEDLAVPTPGDGEILVRLAAIGVNFVDTQQRQGFPEWYRVPLPFTPGFEAAGRVAAVGPGVTGFREDDRVVYQGSFGAYAEFAAVPADLAVPIPDSLETEIAGAGWLQGLTAHYLTTDSYRVCPGDWVLVQAAAGGTGGLVVQMAKAAGATVVATVSNAEKAAVARAAGADHVIDYGAGDFEAAIRALDGFPGLAAVYDNVGRATFEQGLALLRRRGIMVLYGAASGPVEPFDLARLNPMGSLFVTRPNLSDYVADRDELRRRADDLFAMIADGRLRVRIGGRFPLAEAALAHAALESRQTTGKLLLTV